MKKLLSLVKNRKIEMAADECPSNVTVIERFPAANSVKKNLPRISKNDN
jgi:hypothetical protein